jgi:hypothetical protein
MKQSGIQLTVKVGPSSLHDPIGTVREALGAASPELAAHADIEEVFPGLRSGRRAGMLLVRLHRNAKRSDVEKLVEALRAVKDVVYAELEHQRTAR